MSEAGLTRSRTTLGILVVADHPQRVEIVSTLSRMTELELDISQADISSPPPSGPAGFDVIMYVFEKSRRLPLAYRELERHKGGHPVRIALVHDRSMEGIREALHTGADEVLFLPIEQGDVARALVKVSGLHKTEQPALLGKVCSVASLTGGVGVTTVAANCALALSYSLGKKVALLDLDFQSGDLAVALNLEAERSILDLNDPAARLSSVQLESALTKHSSGVHLLAAPKRVEEGEQIASMQVAAVLDLMRQMVDFVIVDVGRPINDTAVMVWERSDQLCYVIDQSVRAMRGAWRFLDLFGRLKLSGVQPKFVLNRWSAHRAVREKHISQTLDRPLFARIPDDNAAMEQAVARGQDLWKAAPRSPLTRSFEAFALTVCGDHQTRKRSGVLSKIFSRNGAHPRS